jgi:hypothetical protein
MKTAELIPTQTAAAGITSVYYDLGDLTIYTVQVSFTGANVVGTLTLEASDDPAVGFVTVLDTSQAVAASGGHMYNVVEAGYRFVRLKWVYTSGTGNIKATIFVKG